MKSTFIQVINEELIHQLILTLSFMVKISAHSKLVYVRIKPNVEINLNEVHVIDSF